MIDTIKRFATVNILAAASLVTSITTLITVPNGLASYYQRLNWKNNIKVIRLNSNDNTFIYNGNTIPIFVDRMEIQSNEIGRSQYIEIGRTINPESYLAFTHKGISFESMYSGAVQSLKANGLLPNEYEMITIDKHAPLDQMIRKTVGTSPTYYYSQTTVFFNMEDNLHELSLDTKSFIVKKMNVTSPNDSKEDQPKVICNYPSK